MVQLCAKRAESKGQMKFAAIKRTVNNDYGEYEAEKFHVKVFDNRKDAALHLVDLYEFMNGDNPDASRPKMLYFLEKEATKDDALFQWEWKRRGNFRSYKIVPFDSNGEMTFYARTKNLFKIKQHNDRTVEIVKRTTK